MKCLKFLNFSLLLTLGMASIVFNSCSKDNEVLTSEDGVFINGVKWAKRNVASPGKFADNPEDAGMFYQWNRKVAWPATGDITDWDNSYPSGTTWEKLNDPSPTGWRLPNFAEIQKLIDTKKVRSKWATVNGVKGRKFFDIASGDSIFLPAVGGRYGSRGKLVSSGACGFYWSSAQFYTNDGRYLSIGYDYANWCGSYSGCGRSIRCVAE